jgi:hypothetical protein
VPGRVAARDEELVAGTPRIGVWPGVEVGQVARAAGAPVDGALGHEVRAAAGERSSSTTASHRARSYVAPISASRIAGDPATLVTWKSSHCGRYALITTPAKPTVCSSTSAIASSSDGMASPPAMRSVMSISPWSRRIAMTFSTGMMGLPR